MNLIKWMFRGLVSRLVAMTRLVPFPPHRRDPEVSAKLQVEPIQRTDVPPVPGVEQHTPKDQQHINPAPEMERGHPKR